MKNLLSKPELFNTLKTYNRQKFMTDLMAGIIVGIVALPLAIAFGIASGVSPEKGIITAIVAGFIISFLGGTKVQIGGPTGAFIVIIYGIVNNPEYGLSGLIVATMLAGVILILLGVFKLGAVIKFIPYPIIIGFTAGIAVTIFTTQMGDVLGLTQSAVDAAGNTTTIPLKTPGDFIGKWVCYFQHIDTFNLWNFLMAVLAIIIIAGLPRLLRKVPVLNKIPGSLYGILIVTGVVLLLKNQFGIDCIDTIGDRFKIKAQLPDMEVPDISWAMIQKLMPVAFTIAILGAIESLLSAAVADGVIGDHHNSNSELVAQGVANLVTPLFGGIPATGAIARTMTNINNGGRSPIAGIIHAIVLLLILLVLMPLAEYIPMAALAGVLVIVSYNMSGWRTFRGLLKNPKSDVATLLVTFILTVIFDLTIAIEVGLVIAAVVFVKRVMETTEINVVKDELDNNEEVRVRWHKEELVVPKGTEVYEINGPYFFGIANKFEEIMSNLAGPRPTTRIIRMRKITFIDSTGIHNLQNLIEMSHSDGIQVILSGVNDNVKTILLKNGFAELLGEDRICANIYLAIERAKKG
ncbi:MAG: STAS domain-containing protein [Bacteroidaceae bacterium]|nr:STAS domain-containing protein [Bacteroidaceae bacterium]MCR4770279.1 STAS domain-containing protein [Bacteroidaceae bacterium]